MPVSSIQLTESEKQLAQRIEFDPLQIKGGPDEVRAVCAAAKQLTESLSKRKAIPEHRLRFFVDPEYNIGGHKSSREEQFERRMNGGDIREHVDFLKYLRYFIHGPSLPTAVIESFDQAVRACGMVTSGDLSTLSDEAKKLTRKHGLDKRKAAEEFYKLALEHGLQEHQARSIRDRVKT